MNYEMTVLAALIQTPSPSTRKVAEVTGISVRKVQTVLNELTDLFGVRLERRRKGNTEVLSIVSWGVFESGDTLKDSLSKFDLPAIAEQSARKHDTDDTLVAKQKAYNRSKLSNYRASLSLEGITPSSRQIPTDRAERQHLRQTLLQKHSQSGAV